MSFNNDALALSPIKGFESGSDHESEYDVLSESIDPMDDLQKSIPSNMDQTMQLYNAICDVIHTQMDVRGLRRALLLEYTDIRPFLTPYPKLIQAFTPKQIQVTLMRSGILLNTTITSTMFEKFLVDVELGRDDDEIFGGYDGLDASMELERTEPEAAAAAAAAPPSPATAATAATAAADRLDQNQSVLSWVTTDDESELLYPDAFNTSSNPNLSSTSPTSSPTAAAAAAAPLAPSPLAAPPLVTPLTMTNDEEALAKAVVDIVDARLRAGFEERDRAIVAVESTLSSFLEILQSQEEQEEQIELMYTERGHPLVPARAFTPGPIPTPPIHDDSNRQRRKTRQPRRFGPAIFQKPKPVTLRISKGIATMEKETSSTRLLLVDEANKDVVSTTSTTSTTGTTTGTTANKKVRRISVAT